MDECYKDESSQMARSAASCFHNCNSNHQQKQARFFTHYDVETLFHEFGHGLQHMLTKIDYAGISGISGVEWDAVELPSQFMENWCWEKRS